MGRKKLPIWGVVASDVRAPRDGRFIEDLGRYYPLEEPARVVLKEDRILYWLQVGAQPTDTVHDILSREGLLLGLHLRRKGKREEEILQEVEAHRDRHREKGLMARKVTPADRRSNALQRESEAATKREAAEAAARQRMAEEKKAAAEAKKAAARAAAEAQAEAEAEAEAAE